MKTDMKCFLLVIVLASFTTFASGYRIANDAVVFAPDGFNHSTAPVFPGFEQQPDSIGPLPASQGVVPAFGSGNGRYTASIAIEPGTSLYGTGEVAGGLLRNGKVTENWNSDVPAYGIDNKSLYQSHPWVLAVRSDGSSFGALALTTYCCEMNLQNGIKFSAAGPQFAVMIFSGKTPQEVLRSLAKQIGTIALPPRWALGYQQCRYSYYPDSRVREIADGFRNRNIPCDVIWLDIDYMDNFRVFTFNKPRFPDVLGLNKYLHDKNFHSVWMIDPGVAVVNGYSVYESGMQQDAWVKNASGSDFIGEVWPGNCVFPDFTSTKTATWWGGLYKDFMANGIDGVWNDMNEPSVFNGPGVSMPEDNKHVGGVFGIKAGTHAQYHNIYGFLMVKASREGIMAANPDKRPFVLSRSNFTGGQRYAATWTGDNIADWTHLQWSVPMVLNMSCSGQPFSGPDIGGYRGNGDAALFARWIGVGTFLPFCRSHTEAGNRDKEPWAWDDATTASSRTALNRRYVLMPYLYTLFYQSSIDGSPVAQPAFFADLTNANLRSESRSFLLGSDLLIVPNLEQSGTSKPNEPRGTWREIRIAGENPDNDINQPRIKIRSGAIISTGPLVQSTVGYKIDTLTLWVCPDSAANAKGLLYEDEGDGYGYQSGNYRLSTFVCVPNDTGVTVRLSESKGSYTPATRILKVKLVTKDKTIVAYGNEKSGVGVAWNGASERTTTITTYRIKCRHLNGPYLYDNGTPAAYAMNATSTNYEWLLIDAGSGTTVLKNFETSRYMNISNNKGYVECGTGDTSAATFKWTTEDAGNGYIRIKSLTPNNNYINVEKALGYAEVSAAGADWWSAMWMLEPQTHEITVGVSSKPVAITPQATLSFSNNAIIISNAISGTNVTVYNVLGKIVLRSAVPLTGISTLPLKLGRGVYVCRLAIHHRATGEATKFVVR
jgi:alpha-glucosidase